MRRGAGRVLLAALLLLIPILAGCSSPFAGPEKTLRYTDLPGYAKDLTGRNATAWPKLENATLTLLDNGAFGYVFNKTAAQFKQLTGITVTLESGGDTLASEKKLQNSHASGKYDLIWGVDNMIYGKAVANHDLLAYKPRLADRIQRPLLFFEAKDNASWFATPADHGYIGINVDNSRFKSPIDTLSKVRLYADKFVTEDPQTSSPGLGFLLTTISVFDENPAYSSGRYDWKAYWKDLFQGPDRDFDGKAEGCVLVTKGWTEAYVQHFSKGYGVASGGLGDKPIVVSYSQSPAYEGYFGSFPTAQLATPIVANGTTYHQIQTIAIANGTKNLQAAQAWVEFTLTDAFQEVTPTDDAMYPAVIGRNATTTFQGLDPQPGTFRAVEFDQKTLAQKDSHGVPNLDRWLTEWNDLHQDTTNNCNLHG